MSAREPGKCLIRLGAALLWLAFAACGQPAATTSQICRDRVTGKCSACPGTIVCVDAFKCTVISCGDINVFVGDAGDATSTDAKSDSKSDTKSDIGGDVDAGVKDIGVDTGFDGGVSDSGADDGPPLDVPCSAGSKQCAGNVVQVCSGGSWSDLGPCPTGQACGGAGVCGCGDPCPAVGLVECLKDVPALRTCQLGADKCLAWGLAIACKPGEVCELGQCKAPSVPCNPACPIGQFCQSGACVYPACNPPCAADQACKAGQCVNGCDPGCDSCHVCQNGKCVAASGGGGTLSCSQIVACVGNCPFDDPACPGQCLDKGSCGAQTTFSTYKGCINATCKSLAQQGKADEAMFCMFQNCGTEQAACLGAGSGTCSQLNDCLNGCTGSATCASGCNAAASLQGGQEYYGMMTCVGNACTGKAGDEQVACAQQFCNAQFTKCFGSNPGGGTLTSCWAIAQCQTNCGGSLSCAKACTAQGTAQAQADVNAFIDCRDQKCGSFCNGSNDGMCNNCVTQFCAAQLAACSP